MTNQKKQLYKLKIINSININPKKYITKEIIFKLNLEDHFKKIISNMVDQISYKFIFNIP